MRIEELTDVELRDALRRLGRTNIGPVNSATRRTYANKLRKLLNEQSPDSEAFELNCRASGLTSGQSETVSYEPSQTPNEAVAVRRRSAPDRPSKIPGRANIVPFEPSGGGADSQAFRESPIQMTGEVRSGHEDTDQSELGGAVERLRGSLRDEEAWLRRFALDSVVPRRRLDREQAVPSSLLVDPAPPCVRSPLGRSLPYWMRFSRDAFGRLLQWPFVKARSFVWSSLEKTAAKKLCSREAHYGISNYSKRRFFATDHETSWHILLGLILFLLFLMIGYVSTVYCNNAIKAAHYLYGAGTDTLQFVYRHMILPVLVLFLLFGFAYGIFWYKRYKWHKIAEEQRQIFEMVEEIIATLKKHHEDCSVRGNRQPYLAVPHVRDMLIPPHHRKELYPIWDKAVEYLNENESRVRTENQCISGEEFMVWRWLQIANQHKPDEKIWQGHAFPEEEIGSNAPKFAYFECLKLRGLFDPATEDEDDWPEHIQDAILEKLGPELRVMHLAVDLKSKDGCVYMKMATNTEAGEAYKILNGSWFNGRLVSAKYLRPERYHERFPDATRAFVPLHIKKARNSLMGTLN